MIMCYFDKAAEIASHVNLSVKVIHRLASYRDEHVLGLGMASILGRKFAHQHQTSRMTFVSTSSKTDQVVAADSFAVYGERRTNNSWTHHRGFPPHLED